MYEIFGLDGRTIEHAVQDAGVDPADDALVTAVLNAWDLRCV